MNATRSLISASVLALGCGVLFSASPAVAYVACNSDHDCWQTNSKALEWTGLVLTYHNDDWWDAHKGDAKYRLHDADAQHNSQKGYWSKGQWRGAN